MDIYIFRERTGCILCFCFEKSISSSTSTSLGSSVMKLSCSGRVVFNVFLMSFVLLYILFSKRRSHLRREQTNSAFYLTFLNHVGLDEILDEILDECFTFVHFYPQHQPFNIHGILVPFLHKFLLRILFTIANGSWAEKSLTLALSVVIRINN